MSPTSERARLAGLGLRLTDLRGAWITAALVFAAYLATMAHDLTFYDSPELALVAWQLGIGHPIGEPLHTLLGFVFAHLPGVSAHVGLTTFSASMGALSVVPAWSLSEALCPTALCPTAPALRGSMLRGLALVGIGCSMLAWEPASRVEVYTLASFAGLWAIAHAARADLARPGPALACGIALGLAASSHAVIAVASALAIAPRFVAAARAAPSPRSALLATGLVIGGGALGLLPFATLPLVGADPMRFAWGAPTHLDAFLAYLRGADYVHNQQITWSGWLEHALALVMWGLSNATLVIWLVGAAGFVALARSQPGLPGAPVIAAAILGGFVAANVVFHVGVPDYRGYFLVPWWLGGAGIAAAVGHGLASDGAVTKQRAKLGIALAVLPALALLASPTHLMGRRDDPSLAAGLANGALRAAPRNAIVVAEADHWVAPLLFVQEAQGLRPDVVIVPHGLAASRWYWEHLWARHPDLVRIPLEGGGRDGRIARLAASNPSRPVLVESASMAERLGRAPCGVGWLVWTDGACDRAPPDPDLASARLAALAPFEGDALEVASRVGETRGEALWRLGRGGEAARAFVAGLSESGIGPVLPEGLPDAAPPLTGPVPAWSRDVAIHDPARNLVLSGLLLHALGRPRDALQRVDLAVGLGLVEASGVRARIMAPPRP